MSTWHRYVLTGLQTRGMLSDHLRHFSRPVHAASFVASSYLEDGNSDYGYHWVACTKRTIKRVERIPRKKGGTQKGTRSRIRKPNGEAMPYKGDGSTFVQMKYRNPILLWQRHVRLTGDDQASNKMAIKLRLVRDSATPMFWYC
jgi:hypothetical protein